MPARVIGLLVPLLATLSHAQVFEIGNAQVSTCAGAFLDSGGQGASGYSNNEDYTYTICPDAPGAAISVNFVTAQFSTAGAAPIDNMTVYDGNSTGAPVLGNWTGTALEGQVVSATSGNTSGCLTFVWHSNNAGVGVFAGSITCYVPCARPTAAAVMDVPAPARICPGEAVNFNGSASVAAAGFNITSWTWVWGDGTSTTSNTANASHVFANAGGYTVQLYVTDNNGCSSVNLVDLDVLVGTTPNFNGTGGTLTGCQGQELCLTGQVNAQTWNELPDVDLGEGVALPDNVGDCFISELTFTQFPPGSTLTSSNLINQICLNMEHSFMGDLVIRIIGPTGQTVVMHQQGGGGTYLGIPNDLDEGDPQLGTCWTYCFSPTATNGTWVDNAGGTLPAGTYESLNPLAGLVGSPLNGTWTIQICDMWGIDNGFLCDWSIDLDPSLFDNLLQFTPIYGTGCDSTWWTGSGITGTSNNCEGMCMTSGTPGAFVYTYHAIDNHGCTYDTTLTVNILDSPQAGSDGLITICADAGPVDLSVFMDGADPGGTWTLPGGGAGSSVYTPGTSPPGAYTYSVNGIAPCPNDAATITVTQNDPVNAGSDGAITVCADGATVDLFPLLTGAESGGTWTDPNNAASTSTYTPGTSVPGVYTYSLTALAPCTNDAATVTITQNDPVNAGSDGAITVCADGATLDLFPLLTGAESGGTWTDPNNAASTSTYTPGTSVPGVYTYSLTALAPCTNDAATVTVTQNDPVNAGSDGAITVCADGATVDLFPLLTGAESGGTWTDPNNAASTSTFTPGSSAPGVYTYSLTALAPCTNDAATVTVTQNDPVNAGSDGAITVCADGATLDLFPLLTGAESGGTWTDPNNAASTSTYTPGTSVPGVYTYSLTALAPCTNDAATVTVTQNDPVNAGSDGAITVCADGATLDLFPLLTGAESGGTWTDPNNAASTSTYTPGTSVPGVYTYSLTALAPCTNDAATVTITQNDPVNAGSDGAITVCADGATLDLFPLLTGAESGGTWTDPNNAASTSTYTPGTSVPGVYTYSLTALAPCTNDAATVTVTQNDPVNAGSDGAITVCADGATVDLFPLLTGAESGGTWTDPNNAASTSTFTPGSSAPGVYTYSLTALAPCTNDAATVTVTQNDPVNAGSDGAITVCADGATLDLFPLLTGAESGGTWTDPNNAASTSTYTPGTSVPGVYTYSLTALAPCTNDAATVTVTQNDPVNAGSDGAITVCADGATLDLFPLLTGAESGGTWTDPNNAASTSTYTPGTSVPGVYTYSLTALAPCTNDAATVTVTQNDPVNAGSDGAITVCTDGATVDLFTQLTGAESGGTWTDPNNAASTSTYTPDTSVPGVYTYSLTALAPCTNDAATVTVTQNDPVNAGSDGAITVCADGATVDLFALLAGAESGGTWTDPNNAASTSTYTPGTSVPGVYTYSLIALAPCTNDAATVTVTQNDPVNAGSDGAVTLCVSSPVTDLFAVLGGTPDAGGSWTAPDGSAHNGAFAPGLDASGAYTYSLSAIPPCTNASATVTVAVVDLPDPGSSGAITLCLSGTTADLFGVLGGTPDAGGLWTAPDGTSHPSTVDPSTDQAGVYTYTIDVPPPCVSVSSTVTLSLQTPPDAGLNGTSLLCVTSPPIDLFLELAGTPEAGGTWTAQDGSTSDGTFTPGTSTPGIYTYTVPGIAPCPLAVSNVEVTVTSIPDAGSPGSATLCMVGPTQELFDLLGGTPDQGGNWTAPDGVSHNGTFDPNMDPPGVYVYTLNAPLPCPTVSSSVTLTVNEPPDPGVDGSLLLCISSPPSDLFNSLGGAPDMNGSWSDPGGNTFSGTFDPGTNIPGTYTYTVAGNAPCPDASATVDVQVSTYPDPGTDATLTLCAVDAPSDLFSILGGSPDPGGVWTAPDGSPHGALFDPTTDTPGTYTYTIAVPAPCSSVSATVTIAVQQPPSAGSDGSLSLCISGASQLLSSGLNGAPDSGGTWTDPLGNTTDATFIPGTDAPGNYTYTVAGQDPCPSTSANVTITVNDEPDAGLDGAIVLCVDGGPEDLFSHLGGSPDAGGQWNAPDGTLHNGNFDPAIDIEGVYSYSITAPPPCSSASSSVIVAVENGPDPGTDGSIMLCISDAPVLLFNTLGGTPDGNGTWTSPIGDPFDGIFDPATDPAGSYTYTLSGTPPCQMVQSIVEVSVNAPADAGTTGTITACANASSMDLFAHLGGDPDLNGVWTGPDGGPHSGSLDPQVDLNGTYTYSLTSQAPCPGDASVVVVTIIAPPDPGTDADLTLCTTNSIVDLFEALGGTPEPNGTWTAPGGSPFPGSLDPGSDPAGTYTYLVAGTSPCPNAQAVIDVSMTAASDAGSDGAILLCSASPPTDLLTHLNGTPQTDGTWSDPDGTPSNGSFDPANDAPGTYTYTVPGTSPCPNASATVLVNVSSDPDAGLPGETTLCSIAGMVDLLDLLEGTPDAGGAWTGPDGAPHPDLLDPVTDPPGTYSYLIAVPPPCTSASSTVTIDFVAPADPGLDNTVVHCATDPSFDLFAQLGGSPDTDGAWSLDGQPQDSLFNPGIDTPGNYLYSVISVAPCPAVTAVVQVIVNVPPDPGVNGAAALCASGDPIPLVGLLGGTPQSGGTWSFDGISHGDLIDPSSDQPGTYSYTVLGNAPCPAEVATVDIAIATEPDPGTSGLVTVCSSGAPIDLFANLGGTPDPGGSWSGPSPSTEGLFDPNSMQPGIYTYLLDVPPPCTSASSTVTVMAVIPPDAGSDSDLLLCASSPITGLIDVLGGDPQAGGGWFAPNGAAHGPFFNPDNDPIGTYVYIVNGMAPCPSDSALATLSVVSSPDPGSNGFLSQCWTDPPEDLFERLEGTPEPGGSWSGPSPCPDGFFHASTMLPGTYFYLLAAPPPCPDTSSNVLVSVSLPPDPGTDGAVTLCTTNAVTDLFAQLNGTPQSGGAWTAPDGSPHPGSFLPAQDPAGIYTYTVQGNDPCPAEAATVSMTLHTPPDAGLDGDLTLCPEAAVVDLFTQLGGLPDAGGTWALVGGGADDGIFDPPTDQSGSYTYTVQGMAPCADDTAHVMVIVSPGVTATIEPTDAICNGTCSGTATLNVLTGTPGYTMLWSGGVADDPALFASGLCEGSYSVAITDANGCTGSVAYVVNEPPPLVIDAIGAGDETCIGDCDGYVNVVDGEGVLFSIDQGFTWSNTNVLTGLCAGPVTVLMQDANGCLASATTTIASPPPVTAGFTPTPDTMNVTATTVAFLNQSGNATQFVWDFGGLGTSTEGDPAFTFPDALGGVYTVCLTAMDANGCLDSVCLPIVVLDELQVSVPNAFTPNGDDINEVFVPVLNMPASAENYGFMIFDRWGLRLFSTEQAGQGWDGTYGGQPVPNDVYVWKVRCHDRVTGKDRDLIGHVTVIR